MGLTKHYLVALLFLRAAAIGGPGPSLPFGMEGKTDGRRKENGTHNNGMTLRKGALLSLFTLSSTSQLSTITTRAPHPILWKNNHFWSTIIAYTHGVRYLKNRTSIVTLLPLRLAIRPIPVRLLQSHPTFLPEERAQWLVKSLERLSFGMKVRI